MHVNSLLYHVFLATNCKVFSDARRYAISFQGVPQAELVNLQLKLLTQATNELDMTLTVAADTPLFVIQSVRR